MTKKKRAATPPVAAEDAPGGVARAMWNAEERYVELFRNAQVGFFRSLIEGGRMLDCNDLCAELMGYESREALLADYVPVDHYRDRGRLEEMLGELRESGMVRGFEAQVTRKDGSPVWVSFSARLYPEEGYIEGAIVDISERRRAEEETAQAQKRLRSLVKERTARLEQTVARLRQEAASREKMEGELRKSEERLRRLTENIPVGIAVTTIDGEITEVNPAILRIFGYGSAEEFMHVPASAYYCDAGDRKEFVRRLHERGEVRGFEVRLKRKDGTPFWASLTSVIQAPPEGVTEILTSFEDIDWRKRAEEDLLREKTFSEAVMNSLPGMFYVLDDQGRIIRWNRRAEEFTGRSPEGMRQANPLDFFAPEEQQGVLEQIGRVFSEGESEVEAATIAKDGRGVPHYLTGVRMQVGDRQYVVGMGIDISERKRAEQALRDSEERLNAFMEASPDGFALFDRELNFVEANRALLRGMRKGDVVGKNLLDVMPDVAATGRLDLYRRVLATGERAVLELVVADPRSGSRDIAVHAFEVGDLLGVISADITERKRAEEALRESERKYRTLVEKLPQKIFWKDKDLVYVSCNDNFARDLGITPEEFAGHTDLDFFPEELARKYREDDRRIIESGGTDEFDETYIEGGQERTVHTVKSGVRDDEGKPLGVLGIFWDVTEQRLAEGRLRETMADLERSNRELEQFAYVASHDLQEPLRMVASYTQLLGKRYGGKLDQDADEFIGYAVDGANRMQALLNDLLAFSRVGTRGKPFERTYCESVFDQAAANLKLAIERNGVVVTHEPLPTVMADEGQLVQLFQNLLDNAMKFRGETPPHIDISARREGSDWLFSVRDNGIGIDPKYADRIFVIFQRLHTKEEYEGTGMGLAICKRIVERHDGRIWMESRPSEGSTFFFTIPAIGGEQA